jgi:adenine-specific DNA-methyltransferase
MLLPDISLRGNVSLDDLGGIYCVNTAYIICSTDKMLLAILNSNLITYYYSHLSSSYRGGYLRFIYQYLEILPIPSLNKLRDLVISLVDQMLETQKLLNKSKTDQDREVYQKKADLLDKQIDRLVYELYGLTEEEINVIEGM